MSPPCQPFTRNGLQKDIQDPRTASFIHVLEILPQLDIENILVENVKGFENSQMRNMLIRALINSDFNYQEFILSPNQFGIPNSRKRYYCLAKRKPGNFPLQTRDLVGSFCIFLIKIFLHFSDNSSWNIYQIIQPMKSASISSIF